MWSLGMVVFIMLTKKKEESLFLSKNQKDLDLYMDILKRFGTGWYWLVRKIFIIEASNRADVDETFQFIVNHLK